MLYCRQRWSQQSWSCRGLKRIISSVCAIYKPQRNTKPVQSMSGYGYWLNRYSGVHDGQSRCLDSAVSTLAFAAMAPALSPQCNLQLHANLLRACFLSVGIRLIVTHGVLIRMYRPLPLLLWLLPCSRCNLHLTCNPAKGMLSVSRHQTWLCAQNEVESQQQELLSQSQAQVSVSNNDEDEVERELRELNQSLFQMHQELMSAQAECDRARSSEEEACRCWEAKRSA